MKVNRRTAIKAAAVGVGGLVITPDFLRAADAVNPFGKGFSNLESLTTGEWWKRAGNNGKPAPRGRKGAPPSMNVPRDQVVAFATYTHQHNVLKLSAQLFPLKPGEMRKARLELQLNGDKWSVVAEAEVHYPGWDAHFRVENWDNTRSVKYRVCHGEQAKFEGLIRRDPGDRDEIVVANLSCNSSRTTGPRDEIVENLRHLNPDLLFFGGDQHYRHTEHTTGWIEFGLQYRDIIRDRPTICIPDDHDVGHGNVWGESGKRSTIRGDADGGYRLPVEYVNQVQRQQTSSLPDPVDPEPVDRGIGVYFTRLNIGGVDFAILEDRKFKSGPAGKIPKMGPRPDHINDPKYDPKKIDLPGLQLLGVRQEKFLEDWSGDWTGAEMKGVLSQTAFCGAVHMHGGSNNRLLADLDCNGWPQTPSRRALSLIRRAWAVHLCGDQHLAVVVKHGISEHGDGPYGFTGPALVNTIYGRWWHPEDEKPGPNPVPNTPLPWTGDFKDGLGNKISMLAYANPEDRNDERKRADGFGIVRFNKKKREVTFECWPRFCDVQNGDDEQFPGWPITVKQDANDGRKVASYLPEYVFSDGKDYVVQIVDEADGEILYTIRSQNGRFQPKVYSKGRYTVKIGRDFPDAKILKSVQSSTKSAAGQIEISI
ncbi:MAG: hypothetical protein QF731_00455 [Verrucomicrobiota bacterium]|nr:hypothetical protein [Verrucomicrobiota bacterium]